MTQSGASATTKAPILFNATSRHRPRLVTPQCSVNESIPVQESAAAELLRLKQGRHRHPSVAGVSPPDELAQPIIALEHRLPASMGNVRATWGDGHSTTAGTTAERRLLLPNLAADG